MLAVNQVNNRVVAGVLQDVPAVNAQRKCSCEKVTRVVLRVLSYLAYALCGSVIYLFLSGQVAFFSAAIPTAVFFLTGGLLSNSSKNTHDFKDLVELAEMKRTAQHLNFMDLTAQYKLVDVLQHEIVPLPILREKILRSIQTVSDTGLSAMRTDARELRERDLISLEMFIALIGNRAGPEILRLANRELGAAVNPPNVEGRV